MKDTKLYAVFKYGSPSIQKWWRICSEWMVRTTGSNEFLSNFGPETADQISDRLDCALLSHFEAENESAISSIGNVREWFTQTIITMRVNIPILEWSTLALRLRDSGQFVHAFLADAEYLKWQNASSPTSYEVAGRPHEHLPRRKSGLPAPHDRPIIDTSRNPGRRILRQGYVEAIGGTMWLSPLFFEKSGGNPEDLRALSFIKLEQMGEIIKVTLDENHLAYAEGDPEMAEKQETLRRILYPKHST